MQDEDEYVSGGTAVDPLSQPPSAVIAYEPMPALIQDVDAPVRLVRGAWAFVVRKMLGVPASKVDRAVFAVKKELLEQAVELLREKSIAPAAWLAWRAKRGGFKGAIASPGMGALLGLEWLKTPGKRGWFRSETNGLFGGRAVVVGDPPRAGATDIEVQAYLQRSEAQKAKMDTAWRIKVMHGGLFINDPGWFNRE